MQYPYAAPTLLLLIAVTGMFFAVHRRQRLPVTLLMFLAWVGFSARLAFVELTKVVSPAGRLFSIAGVLSDCILLSAILVLCAALTPEKMGRREWTRYPLVALLPLNVMILSAAAYPGRTVWLIPVWLGYGALLWVLLRWSLDCQGRLRVTGLLCSAMVFLWGGHFLLRADFDGLETVIAAATMSYASIAYLGRSTRQTIDRWLVVGGLAGWAAVFVASEILPMTPAIALSLDRDSDLLKILTAVGLVISLLQEETSNATDARKREQALRRELEAYAALDLASLPLVSQDLMFDEICAAVSHSSPFRECALLLRVPSGTRRVCSTNVSPATADKLNSIESCSDGGRPGETLPGRLERYRVAEAKGKAADFGYLIPLRTQGGGVYGCLWLGSPRIPMASLNADTLLPLETLTNRVAAALENRELTQRLIRADRLAGLGKLAGGIAHELNNPLTIVRGYAELIEDSTESTAVKEQAGHILRESNRMQRIVADMSNFWRTAGPDYAPVNCTELLQSIECIYRADIQKTGLRLEVNIPPDLPAVMGSRDSLAQVVAHLLQNAVQAMEKQERSPVRETSRQIRMAASHAAGRVHIMVSDDGPGFADPERAFDPFYTTREPGQGTGLGLSVCYGLVRQHRGEISALNLHPRGAAVIIDLPSVPELAGAVDNAEKAVLAG